MSKSFVAFYAAIVVVVVLAIAGIYGTQTGQAAYNELGLTLLNGMPTVNYAGS